LNLFIIGELKNKEIKMKYLIIIISIIIFSIEQNNNFYAIGLNSNGQLGLGNTFTQYFPQLISSLSGLNIISIVSSQSSTWALTNDSRVFVTGGNIYGELCLGISFLN
jgi:alpha-tubulin suppressor-like RCC1 family protein